MVDESRDQSAVGFGTRVTGRVTGRGALLIQGSLQGEVQVTGNAAIGHKARVEGDLAAASLSVDGSLIGSIRVEGPVVIGSGALVRGELQSSEVSIEPGARVTLKLDAPMMEEEAVPGRRRP